MTCAQILSYLHKHQLRSHQPLRPLAAKCSTVFPCSSGTVSGCLCAAQNETHATWQRAAFVFFSPNKTKTKGNPISPENFLHTFRFFKASCDLFSVLPLGCFFFLQHNYKHILHQLTQPGLHGVGPFEAPAVSSPCLDSPRSADVRLAASKVLSVIVVCCFCESSWGELILTDWEAERAEPPRLQRGHLATHSQGGPWIPPPNSG